MIFSYRYEAEFLPTIKEDFMEIENPKNYFKSKKKILDFAQGIDCQVKFDDTDKKSKLIIFSNVYKLKTDKRTDNFIEQDRFFKVQSIKEKILELMRGVNLDNSTSFMNILDENTRAQCKL